MNVENLGKGIVPGYTRNTEMLGQLMINEILNSQSERFKAIKEYLETRKEQLTLGNNTALTTTVVAGFVEKQLRPILLAEGVIRKIPFNLRGATGIKVPKGVNLTAQAISDGTVTADDQNYGSLTITPSWVGLRTSFTHELLQQANVDVIADKLEEMGVAIAKKVDSDILTEMKKAVTKGDSTYGDNSNYVYMGSGTDISYTGLTNAISKAHSNDMDPNFILVNPTNEAKILQDSTMKTFIKFESAPVGTALPRINTLYGMKFLVSSQVPNNYTILGDTTRCGYFVDASPVQTWDGRIDNTIKFEVLAAKCYGVGIVRPKALVGIVDNTAEPT